jgi:hypothetical protein
VLCYDAADEKDIAMTDSATLLWEIRQDLGSVEQAIREHPYVKAVEDGNVRRERFRFFCGEQFAIIGSDLRSVALLVHRSRTQRSREFFLKVLQGESAAWEALRPLARAFGMGEAELLSYEPMPMTQAYPAYMAWLASYATAAEVAAAFLVNFPAWGANCGRLSRALREGYGLKPLEVVFLDLFATAPPGFEEEATAVLEQGMARGAEPRTIKQAARLLQGFERLFWDGLWEVSQR